MYRFNDDDIERQSPVVTSPPRATAFALLGAFSALFVLLIALSQS